MWSSASAVASRCLHTWLPGKPGSPSSFTSRTLFPGWRTRSPRGLRFSSVRRSPTPRCRRAPSSVCRCARRSLTWQTPATRIEPGVVPALAPIWDWTPTVPPCLSPEDLRERSPSMTPSSQHVTPSLPTVCKSSTSWARRTSRATPRSLMKRRELPGCRSDMLTTWPVRTRLPT